MYRIILSIIFGFSLALAVQGSPLINPAIRQCALDAEKHIPFAIPVYDFIESYTTKLDTLSASERALRLQADDVKFLTGSFDKLSALPAETKLGFGQNNNRYSITFFVGSTPAVEVSFPISCQLMKGKNLKELESDFITCLIKAKDFSDYKSDPIPAPENLDIVRDSIFKTHGETYFIPEINTSTYYIMDSINVKPVFDIEHPVESTYNILLANLISLPEINLHITVRKYGLKKEETDIPLHSWIHLIRETGNKIYVGIENINASSVTAAVFIVNNLFRYNHVMEIEIPLSVISQKKGDLIGDISLFIPTHNIENLFGELENNPRK